MITSHLTKTNVLIFTSIRTIVLENSTDDLISYLKSVHKNIGRTLECERILTTHFDIPILPDEYIVDIKIRSYIR
jgi:hypothetical protein